MREQSFSFILKINVLRPDLGAEDETALRGSLRQVGMEETRYFVSFGRLLEMLEKMVVQPPPPIPSAQTHTEQVAPERSQADS